MIVLLGVYSYKSGDGVNLPIRSGKLKVTDDAPGHTV
jgi:hypothetical protein